MRRIATLASAALVLGASAVAHAAPVLRLQVNQHGDFLFIGNTFGYDCATGTPTPVAGSTVSVGSCTQKTAGDTTDSSPDLYWVADDPSNGLALADINTAATSARSSAVLTVPTGATVTNAFLYWAATGSTGTADTTVTLDRPGGFAPTTITATQTWLAGQNNAYQSFADITALVQANGSGSYRMSDIDLAPFVNVNVDVLFGGWYMVVFYERDTDPLVNLALFDGYDVVKTGQNQAATLSGFIVPKTGFSGKLGVAAFEGDNQGTGDSLFFNNTQLSDAQNPLNNFFNSTRSWLGSPVSVAGDLPQLQGTPQSYAGVDLDVVDITASLSQGETSAPIQATTTGDTYFLSAFITSLSTLVPDFTTSTKTATDLSSPPLVAGDTVQYTITATNTGTDTSKNTIVTDPLPAEVTYVPGSIQIVTGANAGTMTDASGDDEAEYDTATRTVTVRLGSGANATMGGAIQPASMTTMNSSSFTFKVKINAGVTGAVANQATVSAAGQAGAPVATYLTGDGGSIGSPTVVTVVACGSNADCAAPSPICDTTTMTCVGCLMDSDCGNTTSGMVCDPTDTCIAGCRGTGGNGCPSGQVCSSTTNMIGQCSTPSASSSSSSSSVASTSGAGGSSTSGAGGSGAGGASVASSASSTSGNGGGSVNTGGAGTGAAPAGKNQTGSCSCSLEARDDHFEWAIGAGLMVMAASRRRRARR